jgi:hypothetical protein
MDNAKLLSALETATDGSEYLDYAIQRVFGLMKPVPGYSRSIDAALTLVPDGWSIHRLGRRHDCHGNFTGWVVELYRAQEAVIEFPSNSTGATAPLALCAAAIRIRESRRSSQADDAGAMAETSAARHRA